MTAARRTVGARDLKRRLGRYLRLVRDGMHIIVTERGRPIAELSPLPLDAGGVEANLDALAARGELTRATMAKLPEFEPARMKGESGSDTLIAEREDRF